MIVHACYNIQPLFQMTGHEQSYFASLQSLYLLEVDFLHTLILHSFIMMLTIKTSI